MPAKSAYPAIPLPRAWPSRVKSGIVHVLSLAQFTLAYTRGWAADSVNTRVRLRAELDRAVQENALLREEIRIKDLRMAQIPRIDAHSIRPQLVAGADGQDVLGHRGYDRIVDAPGR